MENKTVIRLEKEAFAEHVGRVCRNNIRRSCKICSACPLRQYALAIMKERKWKIPQGEINS